MSNYLECKDPLIGKEKAISDLAGRPDLYEKYFSRFVENYSNSYFDIVSLIKDGQFNEAMRLSHSIKGLSRTLGLLPLGDAAELLELSLKENQEPDKINKSLTIFHQKFIELLDVVSK